MKILGAAPRVHSSTVMLLLDKSGAAWVGYHTRANTFAMPTAVLLPVGIKLSIPGLLVCTAASQLDFYWVDAKTGNPRHLYSLDDGLQWLSAEDSLPG